MNQVLPTELLYLILTKVEDRSICKKVCRQWKQIINRQLVHYTKKKMVLVLDQIRNDVVRFEYYIHLSDIDFMYYTNTIPKTNLQQEICTNVMFLCMYKQCCDSCIHGVRDIRTDLNFRFSGCKSGWACHYKKTIQPHLNRGRICIEYSINEKYDKRPRFPPLYCQTGNWSDLLDEYQLVLDEYKQKYPYEPGSKGSIYGLKDHDEMYMIVEHNSDYGTISRYV